MDGATKRLNGTMNSAQLQTGRLGNHFASLTSQLTGLHPIVGNIAGVLGNFAIGGAVTVGVLAGVTAITLAWDHFTKAAREAKKVNDELIASLEKANFTEALGPAPDLVLQTNAARNTLMQQRERKRQLLKFGVDPEDSRILELNVQILHSQTQLEIGEKRLFAARMAAGKGLKTVTVEGVDGTKALASATNEARDAAEEYQLQQQIAALKLKMVLDELQKIADLHAEIAGYTQFTGMPNVSMPFEGLDKNEKKQLQELGILTDTTEESGNKIRDAIWGSATQMANQIVSALNVGGGGKGSNLGGALGGTAGFAAGFLLGGPIGGAIGSTIGNIAGSLFGGLFDSNTKATNANTAATLALTQALLYAPAGFKVESYRNNASDPRQIDAMGRLVRWNASRGGANPLLGT